MIKRSPLAIAVTSAILQGFAVVVCKIQVTPFPVLAFWPDMDPAPLIVFGNVKVKLLAPPQVPSAVIVKSATRNVVFPSNLYFAVVVVIVAVPQDGVAVN